MAPDYFLATTLLKLLFGVILLYDVWRLFLPLPAGLKVAWRVRTSPTAELNRHAFNTGLFPGVLIGLVIADASLGYDWWVILLDVVLLLLVFTYLMKPRTFAILDDKGLWLDGTRFPPERIAGLEMEGEEDHPERLMVLTQWHGLALRKKVVLASEAEARTALEAWQERQG